jgi:hypothetical protein
MLEIYLLPFTILKYVISGMIWVLLFHCITQSDSYYNIKDWVLDKYDNYKERKNPHMPDDYLSSDYKNKEK